MYRTRLVRHVKTFVALLLAVYAVAAHGLLVGLSPAVQFGAAGDVVTVDLFADDLMGGAIGDYDFDILYDPSALTLDTVTFAGGLGVDALNGAFITPGVVDVFEVSVLDVSDLETLQGAGPLVLATLMFTIDLLAPGASTFVSIDTLDPFFTVGDGAGIPVAPGLIDFAEAEIRNKPRSVPEPTGLVLLGLGALILRKLRLHPHRHGASTENRVA